MDALDSDNCLLTANGRVASRDIVQFVPFRNFMPSQVTSLSDYDREQIKARLAKEVLAEVPDQVTSYMKSKNIPARPPQLIMPQDSIEMSESNRTLPQISPQQGHNQSFLSYPEPPPPYNTAMMNDEFVKQPPFNQGY